MDIYQGFQRIDATIEPGIFARLSKFFEPVKAHRWATSSSCFARYYRSFISFS